MKTTGVTKDAIDFCRTVAALCILLLSAPITLAGILVIKTFDACFPKPKQIADSSAFVKGSESSRPIEENASAPVKGSGSSGPLNVLVTGGKMSKASWILRMLGKVGHNVWIGEVETYRYNHTQFSKYCKGYKVLPRPEQEFDAWLAELKKLISELNIDLLVPCTSPVESTFYAKLEKENLGCKILFIQGDTCDLLDDKFRFSDFCAKNDLAVPETHHITKISQVKPIIAANPNKTYIIKPINYDSILRKDLRPINAKTLPSLDAYLKSRRIAPDFPFVLQERLNPEREYGCSALAWDGKLLAFSFFPSDPSCLVYETESEGYDQVLQFCQGLSKKLNLTGMFTVDFMKNSEGRLLAIECNPRIHSGSVLLTNSPIMGHIIAGTERERLVLCRDLNAKGEKWYWSFDQLMKKLAFWNTGIDISIYECFTQNWAIFDWEDPWVFFGMYHSQVPSLLLQDLFSGEWGWNKIDFCIGKMVKVGGD